MTALAADWLLAVPRLGRVDEAVGATLGAVRGAAGAGRVRSRGMLGVCETAAGEERWAVGEQLGYEASGAEWQGFGWW